MMDAEGTCDCYFRAFFDTSEDVQETDTHFRCTDGKPDFQYRLLYNIKHPRKTTKFTVQAYDRDFFKSNDIIGEATIDLADLMEDVTLVKQNLSLNKKWYNQVMKEKYPNLKVEWDKENDQKFYLTLYSMNPKTKKVEKAGKVGIQIDIFPKETAEKNPVGKARDNPNHSPFLPAPQGRLEFSLNPIKMLSQMMSPAIWRKIKIYLCLAVCCALFIAILPNILGTIISGAIMSII